MSLSYEDKLEWITIKNSTIIVFLPNSEMVEKSDETHLPKQIGVTESTLSNALDQGDCHQIFVRIPDTYTGKGRRPAYTQTMRINTSLDSLKEELSLLLAIPAHSSGSCMGGEPSPTSSL